MLLKLRLDEAYISQHPRNSRGHQLGLRCWRGPHGLGCYNIAHLVLRSNITSDPLSLRHCL
jgi:hypothetical protein